MLGDRLRAESMDNYTIGDLTDIIRSTGAGPNTKSGNIPDESAPISTDSWQFSTSNNDDSSSVMPPSTSMEDGGFGNPFSNLNDPLFSGLDPVFFNSSSTSPVDMIADDVFVPNMFTRMLQMSGPADSNLSAQVLPVSPCGGSPIVAASSLVKEIKINNCSSPTAALSGHHHHHHHHMIGKSKGCLMESTAMQISSPTNSGIKRRKSQAKKVVCIPAPAAVNSRAGGEVVPSDLWAWRKYGQKPIKGSPYPRGYYRCSSSKGCSARKQVERSRTDPNMLVITYTSEHNHPWPTQRNALAGSTRSQPSKSNSNSNNIKVSPQVQKEAKAISKEHKKEADNNPSSVKEEVDDVNERAMEIDGGRDFGAEFGQPGYRPSEPEVDANNRSDDFFSDLGEIDGSDPLNLLFSQGFGGKDSKGLDPFGIFDWPEEPNPPSFGVK